jgi:hypothetical protein
VIEFWPRRCFLCATLTQPLVGHPLGNAYRTSY